MKIKLIFVASSLLFSGTTFAANWTPPAGEKIGIMQTADSGITYVRPDDNAGWGMPGCPSATYATLYPTDVNGDTKGPERIFSQTLAARYQGERVRFRGTCNTSGSGFRVDYIIVMPN